jgi:NDP-sugar pyrophosphorylase family protein
MKSLEVDQITGYINAGGRGTRLNSVFDPHPQYGIPKALLELGRPPTKLIDYHVAEMASLSLRNIVVGAGDVAPVGEYATLQYADNPSVATVSTLVQHGTAGDLLLAYRLEPWLFGDHILIKNVDTVLDIDDRDFIDFHITTGAPLSIALTTKKGVPNEGAYGLDDKGRVRYCNELPQPYSDCGTIIAESIRPLSSTGALVLDTELLSEIQWEPDNGQLSLYKDIVGYTLDNHRMAGYDNGEGFFRDIGTADNWKRSVSAQTIHNRIGRTAMVS